MIYFMVANHRFLGTEVKENKELEDLVSIVLLSMLMNTNIKTSHHYICGNCNVFASLKHVYSYRTMLGRPL